MQDVFDRLENRAPASRETALFRDLQHVLNVSRSRVPALRAQLKGIDIASLRTRADLARIPLRRRADLLAAQRETPPFGGYAATRVAGLSHVFSSPVAAPCGPAKDWWGLARGFYAAGLRKGALVLNAFPYDLAPDGLMADAGARAVGCPVLPAGHAEAGRVVEAARMFGPTFYCGRADRLRQILDAGLDAGTEVTSLRNALVTGPCKPGLRSEFDMRGIVVHRAIVLPETGLVAYESGARDAMMLAENLILEIVDPATGAPAAADAEGEMVLTRMNPDYPLLRFATGLKVRLSRTAANCGRTNARIVLLEGGGDGAPTDIRHLPEIQARHPDLRMHLSYRSGAPHLRVEHRHDEPRLREWLGETLHLVTSRSGTVEIVTPGTLPEDDAAVPNARPTA